MKEFVGKVVYNKKLRDKFYLISLNLDKRVNEEIRPGQFAMIGTDTADGLLLRRPYSIFDSSISKNKTNIKFFYKIIGKGTQSLSRAGRDENLSVLLPLGNGFDVKKIKGKTVGIVTGGTGIPPFYLFIKKIRQYKPAAIYVFYGAKTKDEIFYSPFFKKNSKKLFISTDDGTRGYKGFVTDLFQGELDNFKGLSDLKSDNIVCLTCGPRIMMKKVSQICEAKKIKCFASMEEIMGCGMGACLSCVVKKSNSGESLVTVCKDGPVFDSLDIQI